MIIMNSDILVWSLGDDRLVGQMISFDRLVGRMISFEFQHVVVAASYSELEGHYYRNGF